MRRSVTSVSSMIATARSSTSITTLPIAGLARLPRRRAGGRPGGPAVAVFSPREDRVDQATPQVGSRRSRTPPAAARRMRSDVHRVEEAPPRVEGAARWHPRPRRHRSRSAVVRRMASRSAPECSRSSVEWTVKNARVRWVVDAVPIAETVDLFGRNVGHLRLIGVHRRDPCRRSAIGREAPVRRHEGLRPLVGFRAL